MGPKLAFAVFVVAVVVVLGGLIVLCRVVVPVVLGGLIVLVVVAGFVDLICVLGKKEGRRVRGLARRRPNHLAGHTVQPQWRGLVCKPELSPTGR